MYLSSSQETMRLREFAEQSVGIIRDARLVSELLDTLKEDLECHGGDWRAPGFRALATYRFGRWRKQLSSRVPRFATARVYSVCNRFVRDVYGIELYDSCEIGRRFHIGHQGGIVVHLFAKIGDDCIIRQGVTLGVGNELKMGQGPVVGDRVSLGVGCVVMGEPTIGNDVNVGPNSVVSTNIPDGCTVFAPPPRMIRRPTEGGDSTRAKNTQTPKTNAAPVSKA